MLLVGPWLPYLIKKCQCACFPCRSFLSLSGHCNIRTSTRHTIANLSLSKLKLIKHILPSPLSLLFSQPLFSFFLPFQDCWVFVSDTPTREKSQTIKEHWERQVEKRVRMRTSDGGPYSFLGYEIRADSVLSTITVMCSPKEGNFWKVYDKIIFICNLILYLTYEYTNQSAHEHVHLMAVCVYNQM